MSRAKRIYVPTALVKETIQKIHQDQCRHNLFVNVSVAPYHGKKYDRKTTSVVVIG